MYYKISDPVKTYKIGPFTTSDKELKDLFKAWVAISIAFGIVIAGGVFGETKLLTWEFPLLLGISALTVGLGFLLHELAHKIMAQKYHCWAEFRSYDFMLILAVLMSTVGFVFAAPGAVMISGTVTRDRNGKLSAAGPIMNIILALVFLGCTFFVTNIPVALLICSYGFMINTWLAIFNMIPFGNFDGVKIWRLNKGVWIGMIVAAGALFVMQFIQFL